MKQHICIVIFLFFGLGIFAQTPSPQAKLSLLTCDPGDRTEDTWGHNALRFHDPINRIDKVYNYGSYDFAAPNFLLNFLKGKLDYILGVTTTEQFVRVYDYYERSVYEQSLNISGEELRQIYSFLENNAKPENRVYAYEFFDDNCSTRLRDLFEQNLDGFEYGELEYNDISFRQLLDINLQNRKWTDFGIDLILGDNCDEQADFRGAMFLPEYLNIFMADASYLKDGKKTQLVGKEMLMIDHAETAMARKKAFFITPILVFVFLMLFEILLSIKYLNSDAKWIRIYDYLWIFILAIAAFVMMLMWFATEHQTCYDNWNLLWASPLYLMMIATYWMKDSFIRRALPVLIIATTLVGLLTWPQQYHIASVPIMILMILKLIRLYRFDKIFKKQKTSD